MGKSILWKATGIGVALSLVLLIFTVFIPSTPAVRLSPGVPNKSSVIVGTTIIFSNVNLTIRGTEAIPVNSLVFKIFRSNNNSEVAHVNFSLIGTEISDTPQGAFTVVNVTNTSNLPYQSGGTYYGYDEETGFNATGFGYGYGSGSGSIDLHILYTITYTTEIPGTFYAKLLVNSTTHTYISGKSTAFTVSSSNQAPVAHAGGPYTGYVNQSITFDGSTSTDDNPGIKFRWDWTYDGTWDTGWLTSATTTHIYTKAGIYTANLQVQDPEGLTDTDTATVTVTIATIQHQAPFADAGGPYNGLTYGNIQFDGSKSYSINASIVNYIWLFGDGTYRYGVAPTHAYDTPGTYNITLIVTDSNNLQATATTTATIALDANHTNIIDIMKQTIGANITISDIRAITLNGILYYLVDTNDDGIYDVVYIPTTNTKTILGQQGDNLLIDINSDGLWDYVYNPIQDTTTPYEIVSPTAGFWMIIGIFIVTLVVIIMLIILYRHRPSK